MKNAVIGGLIVVVLILTGFLVLNKKSTPVNYIENNLENPTTNNQTGNFFYNGSKFSLNYPNKYTLTENNEGVTITSVPLKNINTAQCQQLEDEQARAGCLNPASGISPFITIKFIAGNPTELWEGVIIGENNGTFVANSNYTYKYNYMGDEFGGRGLYGLFLNDGLLLATYIHQDSEGGSQFDFMKSDEYQLNQHQQKELTEQILKTLMIK